MHDGHRPLLQMEVITQALQPRPSVPELSLIVTTSGPATMPSRHIGLKLQDVPALLVLAAL